jgi:hypothetical protein
MDPFEGCGACEDMIACAGSIDGKCRFSVPEVDIWKHFKGSGAPIGSNMGGD